MKLRPVARFSPRRRGKAESHHSEVMQGGVAILFPRIASTDLKVKNGVPAGKVARCFQKASVTTLRAFHRLRHAAIVPQRSLNPARHAAASVIDFSRFGTERGARTAVFSPHRGAGLPEHPDQTRSWMPSPISSIILALNCGMSAGRRLVTKPLSVTTGSSTHWAPAFSRSVLSDG